MSGAVGVVFGWGLGTAWLDERPPSGVHAPVAPAAHAGIRGAHGAMVSGAPASSAAAERIAPAPWPAAAEEVRAGEGRQRTLELRSNAELLADPEAALQLDSHHRTVLEELIALNQLSEASSAFDLDDGDGRLEPLELGDQLWEDGRLVALALGPDAYASYGYAIELLPASIAGLDALRVLDLHGNQLRALPPEIGALASLRELWLQQNRLEALPEEIGRLRGLRVLGLADNRITTLPRSLSDLRELEELYLNANPLVELDEGLGRLEQLRILDVSQRPGPARGGLRRLPASLAALDRLEELRVAGNQLGCGARGAPPWLDAGPGAPRVFGLSAQSCARRER